MDIEKHKRPVVQFADDQTDLSMSDADRELAIHVAMRATASPHEHVWTPAEQSLLARYALWATQRLDGIRQLAAGEGSDS